MISAAELDNIARARIEDAKVLLTAGRFDGATYLCDYAVEMALKARISRTFTWGEFPSTGGEFQAYRSFPTHELDVLLHLSGQEDRLSQNHFALWNAVAVWKVESRYSVVGTAQQPDATAMIQVAEELLGTDASKSGKATSSSCRSSRRTSSRPSDFLRRRHRCWIAVGPRRTRAHEESPFPAGGPVPLA